MKKKNVTSLRYLTKEGFRNVWVNRSMSIASIAVLLSCLILMGSALLLYINVHTMLKDVGDESVIMVYTKDTLTKEQTEKVGEEIKKVSNLKKVEFIPQNEGWEEFVSSLGSDAEILKGLTKNPLPNAYKITVSDLAQYNQTLSEIRKIDNIYNIRESREMAEKLLSMSKVVTYLSIGIVIVLFFISLFIITNTIRITMHERRLEINIMKSVGATKGFIRWPFMIEGMLLGIIAAIISLLILWGLYSLLGRVLPDIVDILGFTLLPFSKYWWQLLLGFLAVGVGTGVFGSLISMRRYLKEQEAFLDETQIESN